MTRRSLVVLALLALGVFPYPALAHAGLLEAVPAPGSTVADSLLEFRLTFSEPLVPGSTFVVYAGAFQAVPGIVPVIEGASLRAAPAAPLAPGTYTVQWTAVTADGGITAGSYQFRVESSAARRLPAVVVGALILVAGGAVIVIGRRARAHTPLSG